MELWRDAKVLMEDTKRKKEMEMLEERQFWAEIEREERQRKAVIESERRRMLMEHARRLEDFMPYDLLTEEDREILVRENLLRPYKKNPTYR
jgi:hypothetical protein